MRPLPIVGCRRVLVAAVGLVFAVLAVGCSASPATSAQAGGGDRQVSACPRPASLGRAPTAFDGAGTFAFDRTRVRLSGDGAFQLRYPIGPARGLELPTFVADYRRRAGITENSEGRSERRCPTIAGCGQHQSRACQTWHVIGHRVGSAESESYQGAYRNRCSLRSFQLGGSQCSDSGWSRVNGGVTPPRVWSASA
jgi:hypothetical protein